MDTPDHGVAAFSRLFDITVLGVSASTDAHQNLDVHADRVALISGRPILAIPANYQIDEIGNNAIVAWDGSRAAARALFEAMNILETKSSVEIVTVDEESTNLGNSDQVICRGMERHEISVTLTRLKSGNRMVAETLMAHAQQQNASILVMGAYEHSKFKEQLLGGATTRIAQDAQIPVHIAY